MILIPTLRHIFKKYSRLEIIIRSFTLEHMDGEGVLKPRLNQYSLVRMAERQRIYIQASAYRSRLLSLFHHYLTHLIDELNRDGHSPEELSRVEKDLEAIEAALIHLWISLPYNEALTTPDRLPVEQIYRLNTVVNETKKLKRHLKLAHSRAA